MDKPVTDIFAYTEKIFYFCLSWFSEFYDRRHLPLFTAILFAFRLQVHPLKWPNRPSDIFQFAVVTNALLTYSVLLSVGSVTTETG